MPKLDREGVEEKETWRGINGRRDVGDMEAMVRGVEKMVDRGVMFSAGVRANRAEVREVEGRRAVL